MSDWKFLNQHRMRVGKYGSTPDYGFNGAFGFPLYGEPRRVYAIASDQEGWKHVSVSFGRDATKTPSWSIMCRVKDLFWEPEDWVIQYHPAQSCYINQHPGVLHLWQPLTTPLPTPPQFMV